MLHKKISISAVLILGTVFSSSYCFSQTKPDLPGFDFGIFDYQFSRADRESDPGNWMREAGRGIESSMLLWEEILTELNGDPSFNKRITEEFSEWTKGELEKRFSLWLMERFFGRAEFNSEVSRETTLVDMEYTYLLSTDNENHKAEKYLEDWSNRVKNKMNEQISFYNTALEAMYPEILSLIDETRREKFKSQLDELAVNSAGILKMEFDNMLAREERYFTARHTGDTKSLRRQSEDKSAGFTGKKLIEEAKHSTAEGIKSLEKKIDTAEAKG